MRVFSPFHNFFVNFKFTVWWKNKKNGAMNSGCAFRVSLLPISSLECCCFFPSRLENLNLCKTHKNPFELFARFSFEWKVVMSWERENSISSSRKLFCEYFFVCLFSARKNLLLFILSTMHFPSFWSIGAPSSSTTSSSSAVLLLLPRRPNK